MAERPCEKTPPVTPVKLQTFISPSAHNICAICSDDMSSKFKNVADGRIKISGGKRGSNVKIILESYLGEDISETEDLPYVCKNCFRSVSNASKASNKSKERFLQVREEIKGKYLQTKAKRCRASQDPGKMNDHVKKRSKKSLQFQCDAEAPSLSNPHNEANGDDYWTGFMRDSDVIQKQEPQAMKVGIILLT